MFRAYILQQPRSNLHQDIYHAVFSKLSRHVQSLLVTIYTAFCVIKTLFHFPRLCTDVSQRTSQYSLTSNFN
jgi:hypothetical protein